MNERAPAPGLAAIAVSHESAHVLPDWIAAFEALPERGRIELCVVDSGSSAAQRELIEAQIAGRVERFVALPNVGFGAACNAGAEATAAPNLLFVNPDARVRSLPARATAEGGLGGALLGGFALAPHRPLGFARPPGLRQEAEELVLGRWSRAYRRADTNPSWVSGAALLIGREAFERVGGFSPAFFMYFEDADLAMRHRAAGGRVELDAELTIDHGGGQSSGAEAAAIFAAALEGVHRHSGRRFAVRYGRPWDGAVLYLLLALAYLPRRLLLSALRDRDAPRSVLECLLYLLCPRRALRKLTSGGAR